MKGLTDRQREVLAFVSSYTKEYSYPPAVRDISEHFQISLRAVQDHITALQKKGYLSQTQNIARSIHVISDVDKKENPVHMHKIPILHNVVSERPLICEDNIKGYVNLGDPIVSASKSYFAMTVEGDSMCNAGINYKDLAIIEQSNTASSGQVVAVLIDDEIVLKRYLREAERICLKSESSKYSAIYCTEVKILGILSNIIRNYN